MARIAYSYAVKSHIRTKESQALYTTLLTQKAKKYHDGFLQLAITGSHFKQIILLDSSSNQLNRRACPSELLYLLSNSKRLYMGCWHEVWNYVGDRGLRQVQAWVTLGRAQLNFREPDSAIQSFDKALAIKPDSEDAQDDIL
ncbi:uncharacterized protein LOC121050444 [Rosa chinensis]|uniref:uncharacterized protein LOC121050444 n=1 Tax=Rosa chinensis TaxID=74649 RepID=UPI001AD8FB9E|nr:uncharacterized protein LOC121050444 [Rosa chinensis]